MKKGRCTRREFSARGAIGRDDVKTACREIERPRRRTIAVVMPLLLVTARSLAR
jgi:hypothetical protein